MLDVGKEDENGIDDDDMDNRITFIQQDTLFKDSTVTYKWFNELHISIHL